MLNLLNSGVSHKCAAELPAACLAAGGAALAALQQCNNTYFDSFLSARRRSADAQPVEQWLQPQGRC